MTERLEDRLRQQIRRFRSQDNLEEIGTVTFIGDGIARVIGLENVMQCFRVVEYQSDHKPPLDCWAGPYRGFLDRLELE